jgi:hypothetical protein
MRSARFIAGVAGLTGLLVLAGAASCTDHEAGIVLLVQARVHAIASGTGAQLADGSALTIKSAYLDIASVEVVACPSSTPGTAGASARRSTPRRLLRQLAALLSPVSVAHAHDTGPPTISAVPAVVNLGGTADGDVTVGTVGPPPGRYCSLNVMLGPASDASTGLPGPQMLGETFVLTGQRSLAQQAPSTFELRRRPVQLLTLDLTRSPLVLDESGTARLLIDIALEEWLGGLNADQLEQLQSPTAEPWTTLPQIETLIRLADPQG